jgi:hypothetical protein
MGLFSFFSTAKEHNALIDSGKIEPNIKNEFDTEKEAKDFVLRMMTAATFMAGGYKNYPRVYKNNDGKWIGAIFQIPK